MFRNIESKDAGGLLGAIIGSVLSLKIQSEGEKEISKAGKTALFTGLGFFVGRFFAGKINKNNKK